MNWKAKAAIQWALAPLPYGEHLNFQLQKLNGSHSDRNLQTHLEWAEAALDHIEQFKPLRGATLMEIGTGWIPVAPMCMVKRGAARVVTFDLHRHLRPDLSKRAMRLIGLPKFPDEIDYHAPADAANTGLPDASVDVAYSSNVLEHIPHDVVTRIVRESRRILKPGGLAYHDVGLHDHRSDDDAQVSKIDFLRYSERKWRFMNHNRIAYHNRMRACEFLKVFQSEGFKILDVRTRTDERELATLQNGFPVDSRFQGMPPEELAVWNMKIVLST